MNTTILLPDKPSALIRLALDDLKKCESQPDTYIIDMYNWVVKNSHCRVCLAGAVMVNRFAELIDRPAATPLSLRLRSSEYNKLLALNEFRGGWVGYGLRLMNIAANEHHGKCKIAHYEDSKDRFHLDMNKLADDLEAKNL